MKINDIFSITTKLKFKSKSLLYISDAYKCNRLPTNSVYTYSISKIVCFYHKIA